MVKPVTEIIESLREKIGDDASDDTLTLLEDISDTFNDYETKTKDSTNWEQKFKDNDDMWRKKYRDRFFNSESNEDEFEDDKPTESMTRFEDLFD